MNDKYIHWLDARKLFPSNPTRQTLHRWAKVGIRGNKLATILIGGRRYLTKDAIEGFIARGLREDDNGAP